MFNLMKNHKKLLAIGILFFFSAASGFAYVKTCCDMEKPAENHSCCSKKASLNYKNASKCECKLSVPRDIVFEDKNNVTNNLLKYTVLFVHNAYVANISSENNDLLNNNVSLFKSCSVPIFLKDCSFLI